MIKKVIHLADLHIRNFQRHEEYKEILSEFLNQAREIVEETGKDETRIVIVGDLVHQKIVVSNEQNILLSWLLRECNNICKTLLVSGNHDYMESNKMRLDSITPVIRMLELPNVVYLDMELEYKGGFYEDDNIMWSLFSVFDDHTPIDVKIKKVDHPDKIFISLFHGMTVGLRNEAGFVFEHGKSLEMFGGSDIVMCGDVHLKQEQNLNGLKIVQPGSLIQQNFGETVSNHGYLVWDLETMEYDAKDIQHEYGFYKFKISSITEVEDGLEEFVNF